MWEFFPQVTWRAGTQEKIIRFRDHCSVQRGHNIVQWYVLGFYCFVCLHSIFFWNLLEGSDIWAYALFVLRKLKKTRFQWFSDISPILSYYQIQFLWFIYHSSTNVDETFRVLNKRVNKNLSRLTKGTEWMFVLRFGLIYKILNGFPRGLRLKR